MKKIVLLTFAVAAMFAAGSVKAQVSHGGEPYLNHSMKKAVSNISYLPALDNSVLLKEDINQVKGSSPLRVGVPQDCSVDVLSEATLVKDAQGQHFQLAVSSPGATFMTLGFSKFQLPEEAEVFFYDATGDFVLGSYNGSDVSEDGTFYVQAIPGDVAYIEVNVPEGVEPGKVVLGLAGHGYKDIFQSITDVYESAAEQMKGPHGDADGDCHINVVCEEGDDWRDQIRSVVAIQITTTQGIFMCSGALINNCKRDKTPYVLSAYHCQDEEEAGVVRNFTSYFGYETTTCTGRSGPSQKAVTSASIKAKLSYQGGSDFLLLLLGSAVPDVYEPYYSGWDRNDVQIPEPGACIHHPGGDYKKISFPQRISRLTGSYVKFYRVKWYTGTLMKGVTEQGSSGSPLYNADKRIIGQLWAGSSSCEEPEGEDYYGRFYSSWTGNGLTTGSLQPWLDPNNSGVTTLDGMDYTEPVVGISVTEQPSQNITVYPNPTTGKVSFDIDALGRAEYKVFDLSGHCVKEGSTVLTATVQAIDLGDLSAGNYLLQITTSSRRYSARIVKK